MKKFLTALTCTMMCLSAYCLPVFANSSESNEGSNEIYVDENYASNKIQPRTRGNCTDVYSRDWCNAHGYQNNRPVGGTVILNSKEKGCYLDAVLRGVGSSFSGLITGNAIGVFSGPAYAVYEFWRCLF